jgi:hypothetical protein
MLTIELIWKDPELAYCRVRASGQHFKAAADVYFAVDSLPELAGAIRGFPTSQQDRREWNTQDYNRNSLRLALQCIDSSGHGFAVIELADHFQTHQTATIRFPVTAGEVDEFEKALRTINTKEEGSATLGSDAKVSV